MSTPFVFVPEDHGHGQASSSSSNAGYIPYVGPKYFHTPAANTPFLPPSPMLYPTTPLPEFAPLNPNPFDPAGAGVAWPAAGAGGYGYDGAMGGYGGGYERQRTKSWAGPPPGTPGSPFLAPAALPAFLGTFTPGHKKAKSWGNQGGPPPWAQQEYQFQQIHPLLNGDAPAEHFFLDLSATVFRPVQAVRVHPHPQVPPAPMPLGPAQYAELAFYPPRTTLRILLPGCPFWPVDLAIPEAALMSGAPPPPIALGDILVALHRALHTLISQADWRAAPPDIQAAAARAFTVRCRQEAMRSGVPAANLREKEMEVRQQGVKRIDFLNMKVRFRGLVRAPEDPDGVVRLVVA